MISIALVSFILSFLIGLFVIKLTYKHNLFIDNSYSDKPQNFHETCTPRAGGIGILAGIFLSVFTVFGIKFIVSVILAFASGIFEDFHNSLSARLRLFLQIIAAAMAIWLTDAVVTYLGLGITLPFWAGAIFSIFAIVGMMNAINMIDGFNGLASGVILIILISFGVITYQHNNYNLLYVISIIFGSTLGFFILVFPKGKIFLGDGGAYMLGFIIAVLGIFLASKYENVSPWFILSIFIYPVWEVLFSIGRKFSIGLSPMKPDSYHFHMLVHRQITQNNPMTALLILLFIIPFAFISTLYAKNSIVNIYISLVFILFYTTIYIYLYIKDTNK